MSKETTLKKEFSERDLQRIRNLATKKVNDKTVTSVGYSKAEEFHEEGDVWEENGRTWTIKNGIKRTVRKTDAHTVPFLCPKCSKPMKHQFDKRMYAIHQMCLHCTTEMESELKMQGKYEEYERDMIRKNAQYFVENIESGVDQFLDDLINETYVMEDGTIQNWVGNGLNKQEVKQQILEKIQKIKAQTQS
jgi:IS1 family transposase